MVGSGEIDHQTVSQQTKINRNSSHAHQSPKMISVYSGRRKSSLSYQQQLQLVTATGIDGIIGSGSCNTSVCDYGANSGSCTSPNQSPYAAHNDEAIMHHQHHTKLSIHPIDRYEDTLTCCLPPPSPAPTSDRFIMGMLSPSVSTSASSTLLGSCNSKSTSQIHYNNFEPATANQNQLQTQTLSSPSSVSTLSSSSVGSVPSSGIGPQQQEQQQSTTGGGLILSQKYTSSNSMSTLQRSLSPNSRFRMSDRFRELGPKCQLDNGSSTGVVVSTASRFVSKNSQFLSQTSPLASNDAFTYLSSAVHTPVKRYVPTPPPPNELFTSDIAIPMQTGVVTSKPVLHASQQHTANVINTLPYRFRMKCCSSDAPQQQQMPIPHLHEHRSNNMAIVDNYATSPRSRLTYKCGSNGSGNNSTSGGLNCEKDSPLVRLHDKQLPQTKSCNSSVVSSLASASSSLALTSESPSSSGASSVASPGTAGNRQSGGGGLRCTNDYMSRTPSIEYMNSSSIGRVMTPVNVIAGIDTPTGVANNPVGGTSTCLHCNTMRRTTGVHQTTQTTGPISPVPVLQHQLPGDGNYSKIPHATLDLTSSISTPSTSESHMSPLSPSTSMLHQQKLDQENGGEVVDANYHHMYQQHLQQQQRQLVHPQNIMMQHQPQSLHHVENHSLAQQKQQQTPHYHHQQSLQSMQLESIQQQRYSRQQRLNQYVRKEIAKFFGVDVQSEADERNKWYGRHRRLALRRFGILKSDCELNAVSGNSEVIESNMSEEGGIRSQNARGGQSGSQHHNHLHATKRPDILPAQDDENNELTTANRKRANSRRHHYINAEFRPSDHVECKASVPSMFITGLTYVVQTLNKGQTRQKRQWSRSFAPAHVMTVNGGDNPSEVYEGLTMLQEEEVFFDSPGNEHISMGTSSSTSPAATISPSVGGGEIGDRVNNNSSGNINSNASAKIIENQRQLYIGERGHGWRISAIIGTHAGDQGQLVHQQHMIPAGPGSHATVQSSGNQGHSHAQPQQQRNNYHGKRIASQILDGVLENSRRPLAKRMKIFSIHDLDDRNDHRPFFTYWINTVQILVLFLAMVCYGIGPIGFGVEQKTGQVLVTSLSLQTVQHQEQRNVWIGPRNSDLVHMGAKFATCMRRDVKIMDVLLKTRRHERETACCIRNDDSGCVQSSQADCSVRGLFPTKSISTWKKWSPGESGPGGRISGSVCGLDPKYCDAPASIAPYEWPDDITKWPICRKTNSFSQRFRYKDHTAEHMVCEVIGHPCCTGVFGECRITTREYCDFVNGYFHEEASLCSQISCLNNVCGMFPFFSVEMPDQFYRLFTSLCLHAGILHLAITVAFQHVFLADLERLIGPIRTAILYIGSGLAGNLTSAVLVPYKPEVGPLASLSGVVASLVVLLILMHWKQLHKPHVALFKLILIGGMLFGLGTLPWQLNFAGLLAGIFCGIFLTVALVPFVSVSKYGRKTKINLIWCCVIIHLFIYTVMLIIFYIFPTELTNLNFGEVLSSSFSSNSVDIGRTNGIESFSNNVMSSSSTNVQHQQQQQQQTQYHHHHHSDDIISNSALNGGSSSTAAHMLQSKSQFYYNHNYYNSHNNKYNNNNDNKPQNSKILNSNILYYDSSNQNINMYNRTKTPSNHHLHNINIDNILNNSNKEMNFNNSYSKKLNKNNYNVSNKNYYNNNNRNSKSTVRYINTDNNNNNHNNKDEASAQMLHHSYQAIDSNNNYNNQNNQQQIRKEISVSKGNSGIKPSVAATQEQQVVGFLITDNQHIVGTNNNSNNNKTNTE